MTTTQSTLLCEGCKNDWYNNRVCTSAGCWCYERATVVHRTKVGTWQPPPYRWRPEITLSCHTPEGLHWIDADDPRIEESEPS